MCRDIGGSATIRSGYDLLLGIARASTLLRVTVINDEHDFETPLLLPASLQELMGATTILGDGGVQGQRWATKATPKSQSGPLSNPEDLKSIGTSLGARQESRSR